MAYDPFISHSGNSSIGNIQPRNPHFVGRKIELTRLQNVLAAETFCIISAARAGVGTTALAVEYAHRFAGEYTGGRWLVLCESGGINLTTILAALHSHRARISETERCLLVLDNVAQPELLKSVRQLFAKRVDWLYVILTTTLKEEEVFEHERNQTFLTIEGLPQEDVLALIESFQPNERFASDSDRRSAVTLASLLDGFTLPAELAAASVNYFNGSPTLLDLAGSLFEVLTEVQGFASDSRIELTKTARQDHSLRQILRIILDHLSKPARFVLDYAASSGGQLELSEIRESLAREFPEMHGETDHDQIRWQLLINDFFNLQLWQPTNEVDANGELQSARMHPLLRLSIKQIFTFEIETDRDGVSRDGAGEGKPVDLTRNEVSQAPHPLDENVMFTVYRRKTIAPNKWYPLLVFAHLSERRPDASPDEPDPVVEVKRQAEAILGVAIADYKESSEDSSQPIPRSGELMFKPSVPGVEFNPPSRTFKWEEPVHREEFKMRATHELDGQVARGWLRVFLGPIIVAEVNLTFKVDSNAAASVIAADMTDHARPFRKVFASYSHKDKAIVEEIEKLVRGTHLGLEYLRDVTKLRSGDVWNDSLLQMIDTADVFQLFWSSNSMDSPYVRREYERALARQVKDFVRPVYWEKPFPERPEHNLPPEALKRLHFEELSIAEAVRLPDPVRVVKAAEYCKRCGRKFERDQEYCSSCGSRRRPADTSTGRERGVDLEELDRYRYLDPPAIDVVPAAKYPIDADDIRSDRWSYGSSKVKSGGSTDAPGCIGSPVAIGVSLIVGAILVGLVVLSSFLVLRYFGFVPLLIGCSILLGICVIVFVKWIRDRKRGRNRSASDRF